jgi:hypothetical protein
MRKCFQWAVLIGVGIAVNYWYGAIGWTRFIGVGFVLAAVSFIFVPELPVHFGPERVATLIGWKKVFGILPAMGIACLLIYYGVENACAGAKYKHHCA